MILAVAIDTPLARSFDYRPPAGVDAAAIQPGQRLWVPFGRRRVVGMVIGQRERSEVAPDKLRAAYALIDEEPALDRQLLELLLWAADYYRHPIGEVIAAALPKQLRQGTALAEVTITWRLTALGQQQAATALPARAARLRAVIEHLRARGESDEPTLRSLAQSSADTLTKLANRGYIEQGVRESAAERAPIGIRLGPQVNPAQAAAIAAICRGLDEFASYLLYGVTGSGKTEVYLNVIAEVLRVGKQALILVPEIALTPQLIARFHERFEAPIAIVHSALTDSERLTAWRNARSGVASVIIGTRSAVFVPLARPGIIVVDEEHDASFKQQEGFRYSARDLALMRAQRLRIPVVLGSATPSLETLARAQKQPQTLLSLPHRAGQAQAPQMSLVDLRKHGSAQGIATPVLLAMRRHLDCGGQVLLFLNRRGYAPVLFCPGCGWTARCPRCDAHLTVHRQASGLICHHCGAQQAPQSQCPSCAAPVKPVGQGTERIEETVSEVFPDAPLARIDRDSMQRKGQLEATLAQVDRNQVRILVGTQMLTKGHHFPNVTLVVVLNADHGLFSTDFRSSERLAQTIVQVAGRAGRAERSGEVLIQTEYPEHPLLQLLLSGGYEAFARGALTEREQSGWPPFTRLALLRAEAAQPAVAMQFLQAALVAARRLPMRGVHLLGPAPAPMERRAGRHRAQLLLQAATHTPLQRFMQAWLPAVNTLPLAKRVRWSIDVDPGELF